MLSLQTLVVSVKNVIDNLLPVMVGAALLTFLWGLVRFISRAGSDKAAEEGKNLMVWGVIALFIMVSVWGLVFFLQDAFLLGGFTL